MNIRFLKIAEQELYDAQDYYENEQLHLGNEFKDTIYKALKRIIDFPEIYVKVKLDIRRCVIHKFPYNILYSIENSHIIIIAIAHQHRQPDYWVKRIK